MAKIKIALQMLETAQSKEQQEQYLKILQEEYKQEICLLNEFSEIRNLLTPENIKLLRQYNLLHEA